MASLPAASTHFDVPTAVRPYTINRVYSGTILAVHLLALLAFFPQFFSWIGFWTMVVGIHVFGQGITIGYHRLLTHRSFKTPPWVEHCFAILGICCLEDSPARWVAVHRIHHVHSDEQSDPHSPLVTFFWSHFGWLMVNNRDAQSLNAIATYAKDLLRDPFYMRIEKRPLLLMWIGLAQVPVFFLAGAAIGWIGWGREAALPLALSMVVWGVYVRIVAVWHICRQGCHGAQKFFTFTRRHTRHRFVQQQDAGLTSQGNRHFKQTSFAIGELLRRLVHDFKQVELAEQNFTTLSNTRVIPQRSQRCCTHP